MAKEKPNKSGRNWKLLQKRSAGETLRNRDVYESQQLERSKMNHKETMTSRAIIAAVIGVIVTATVWGIWSAVDQGKGSLSAAKGEIQIEEITEQASDTPRDFSDLEYANMTLEKTDYYANFGYDYYDIYTKTFYTEAEYKQWAFVQRRLENNELHFANKWDETLQRYVYAEREPLDTVSPDHVRELDDLEWLNMRLVPAKLYSDIGYTWADLNTITYYTQAEYNHWLEVTENAVAQYNSEEVLTKDAASDGVVREMNCNYKAYFDEYGNPIYQLTSFEVTPEQYLSNNWRSKSYLTIPAVDEYSEPRTVTVDANRNIIDVATEQVITDDVKLTMNYRSYSWYDSTVIAEREVITEKASVVAREFTDLEYANMRLITDTTYANYDYYYLDTRTGKYYTKAELAEWNSVQNRLNTGELKLWREKSDEDDGYVYSESPPSVAGVTPREFVLNYTDENWMGITLTEATAWADYGYTYADPATRLYYSEAEYELWKSVQDRIASGEIEVPVIEPEPTMGDYMKRITLAKLFVSLLAGLGTFGILYQILKRNLDAQNLLNDTSDINQYDNDQHIALPEEIQQKFDWFPDAGAHSPVQVSSMISHMMLSNKGLSPIDFALRADKDIVDEDGDIVYYKGEVLLDDDGNEQTKKMPLIDMDFGEALFEASGNPKEIRKFYDTTKIPYNPGGKDRTKQAGEWNTVAEMINHEWKFPLYEPQRPAGAYIVDTEPVNTMVLAITRAGKGQTVIEPTLDMWTREMRPNNMVVNDPKGELLVKFYVRGTVRGFQIVQFNLINAMKTDIYNPLGMAADAAREGDFVKCAMYVDNIASVFFPVDGGDDPVWPNAANNAFKRAAYGLMDFYLEEEKELRRRAERTGMDEKLLETQIDVMWGKVTLYNCYQLFVQLTSKKLKNPAAEFAAWSKEAQAVMEKCPEGEEPHSGNPNVQRLLEMSDEEYEAALEESKQKQVLWEDKPETDLLSLYFTATDMLPKNSMRNLVSNANNALKSMAGAEKMLASVYGIAITAMSFFTDPTISTLTSGTPSQNVDLAGMSFPRRLGVRFHSEYIAKYHLVGLQVRWSAYEDDMFTKELGKDFTHEDLITREGWARYYFKGIFPSDIAYLKMRIMDASTNQLINTFYFKFTKSYQTSLDGRFFVKDPVLGDKIVKNGTLIELKPQMDEDGNVVKYSKAKTTFTKDVVDFLNGGEKKRGEVSAIIRTLTRYAEKPKMVFLVTPPHLMNYAKLILILIKQLVDLNFDQSYMTKSNQKPLYKTRFMLDELGNLQSEGHGISGFETMLSIGLGQEQQWKVHNVINA